MRTQIAKRILLPIAGLILVLGLIALASRRPSLCVTILNSKFRLLTLRISHGKTHKLYMDNWPKGQMMELIRSTGLKAGGNPLTARTTNNSHALVARFIGDFAPGEKVWAEVVDGSGTITRCAPVQGYRLLASPHAHGMIWLLDSPLTNTITIRLRPLDGNGSLAEIRIGSR